MDGLDFAPERPAERLRRLIADSATVAVFTGAGVSTESGIPEVRPPGGTASRAMTARGNGSGPDGRSPGTKKAPPGMPRRREERGTVMDAMLPPPSAATPCPKKVVTRGLDPRVHSMRGSGPLPSG